ncbi:MAG: sigma-E factor regulatory protein RseB domain-containing protein [Nocardioidaceae bacterium]
MSHLHQRVSALVDGELQGRARDRALAHARSCAPCRDDIAATLALKQRLGGLPPAEPAGDLFGSLGPAAPQLSSHEDGSQARVRPRRLLMGAGSVSLAVLSVAYAVGTPSEPTTTLVAPPLEDYTAQFARDASRTALTDPAVNLPPRLLQLSSSQVGPTFAGLAQTSTTGPGVFPAAAATYRPSADSDEAYSSELVLNSVSPLAQTGAADEAQAAALLHSVVMAPLSQAYQGTRVISVAADNQLLSAQIEVDHAPTQGTSYSSGHPSGATAAFVAAGGAELDRLSTDMLEQLLATYDVTITQTTRLLGRTSTVIEARRDGQLAARFWVDQASRLLLRRDLYDGGRLARSSRFTSLEVTHDAFLSHLPPEVLPPSAEALSMQVSAALHDEGWICPETVAGAGALISLRRLGGVDEGVQATYTDGLVTTSVFEQRGGLDPSSVGAFTQAFERINLDGSTVYLSSGFPSVAVWQSGSVTYTMITDAGPETAEEILAALPQAPAAEESGSRLADGLGRMWALLDPTS